MNKQFKSFEFTFISVDFDKWFMLKCFHLFKYDSNLNVNYLF